MSCGWGLVSLGGWDRRGKVERLTDRSEWRTAMFLLVLKAESMSFSCSVALWRMMFRACSPCVARMT